MAGFGFSGDYETYAEACQHASGYQHKDIIDAIVKKTKEKEMEKSKIIHETDMMLTCALSTAICRIGKRNLRILDIGGQFGAHYFSMRSKFGADIYLEWDVLETPAMAQAASENFRLPEGLRVLSEVHSLRDQYDAIIASGSLQYAENPEYFFKKISSISHSYYILNRFPVIFSTNNAVGDRISVQSVPKGYYGKDVENAYPSWFFDLRKWNPILLQKHSLVFQWDDPYDGTVQLPSFTAKFIGILARSHL